MKRVQDLDGKRLAVSQLIAAKEEVLDQIQIVVRQALDGKSLQRDVGQPPPPQIDRPPHGKRLDRDGGLILHNKCSGSQIPKAPRLSVNEHGNNADAIGSREKIHQARQVADERFGQGDGCAVGTNDARRPAQRFPGDCPFQSISKKT